jgi:hypothetical protein
VFDGIQQASKHVGTYPPLFPSGQPESLVLQGFLAWHAFCSYPGERQSNALSTNHRRKENDMKTLIINDLAATCELSRGAMTAIRGGHGSTSMPWTTMYSPTYDTSIKANQNLMQFQDVKNLTANGSAFISGVSATNNTDQFGQNNLAVL